MAIPKELVAASATPMVLSILSKGPNYGYAIIKQVNEISAGHLKWTDGMLYPVLHRLEKQDLITSKWDVSSEGRRRKYYQINKQGTEKLKSQKAQWEVVYSALNQLWENKPCLT
ncbi:MAG: PadR family transcriptional regulator [Planctomycetes bacterium]|nr:PadR family transcriptional regulator [Planctomycetota bacterium]